MVTDESGLFDVTTLLIDMMLFGILIVLWKRV
jgi:hypothetical protein